MKYVLFSLSDEIILPETKRDGTKKTAKKESLQFQLAVDKLQMIP
jgi:hypothetical protein